MKYTKLIGITPAQAFEAEEWANALAAEVERLRRRRQTRETLRLAALWGYACKTASSFFPQK